MLFALIIFDEEIGVKPLMNNLERIDRHRVLHLAVRGERRRPDDLHERADHPDGLADEEVLQARQRPRLDARLFTGFFVSYVILTIVGTFMRGQGMHLMWPWDSRMIRVD